MTIRLYPMSKMRVLTTFSPSTIKRKVKDDPEFPKPCSISARRIAWVGDEVDAWLEAKTGKAAKAARVQDMPAKEGGT